MAIYGFKTEDGEELDMNFPMGECPSEVALADGRIAKRVFFAPQIKFMGGFVPPSDSARRKNSMTKRNNEAHERGKEYWKTKVPKMITNQDKK